MKLSEWPVEWLEGLLPYAHDRSGAVTRPRALMIVQRMIDTGQTVAKISAADGKSDSKNYYRSVNRLVDAAAEHGYNPDRNQILGVGVGQRYAGTTVQVKPVLNPETGEIEIKTERAWVKSGGNKNADKEDAFRSFAQSFIDGFNKKVKPVKLPRHALHEDLLTAYPLGDPHFGMYAWAKETGGDSFDSDIAESDFKTAMQYLISRAPNSHTGALMNMGDLFHVDSMKAVTPESGHLLDTDGRLSYTIDSAARAFRYAIDLMLKKHKEVVIYNLRGNHDPTLGLFFNKLIKTAYENEPRVKVMDNENKFMTLEWGKTGIWLHHGDKINARRLYEAVTRDYGEMWGRCTHRRIWQGHLHHYKAEEFGGCLHEIFQTLAASDAWHAGSGYGSQRSASCITFHKEFGEYDRVKCGIDMVKHLTKSAA